MSDEKDVKILRDLPEGKKKILRDLPEGKRKYLDDVKDDSAYLQSPVINSVKPKPKPSKEAGSNSYAKDNQAAIKKLKA